MPVNRGAIEKTLYKSGYNPAHLYKGSLKKTGYHNVTLPAPAELANTYNDVMGVLVTGKSELRADWQGGAAVSSRVQSVWGTNLITNGNFSNGTTGWTVLAGVQSASNNILTIIGNGLATNPSVWQNTTSPAIVGHKIYAKISTKVYNSDCVVLSPTIRGTDGGSIAFNSIFSPVNGQLYTTSAVVLLNDTIIGNLRLRINSAYETVEIATGTIMEVQCAIVLDLTSIFGAGKEPTAAQMDAMLTQYPNSWFDDKAQLTTDIVAYTANSPSPNYPSEITTTIPAIKYKLPCPWGGYWEYTPSKDMHGLTGGQDKLEVDLWVGVGNEQWKVQKRKFDVNDTWIFIAKQGEVYSFYIGGAGDNFETKSINIDDMNWLSTHFKPISTRTLAIEGIYLYYYVTNRCAININPNTISALDTDSSSVKADKLRTWISNQDVLGNPVMAYYVLATETITPITLTHVDASDAPDFPLSALDVVPSEDYPYSWIVSQVDISVSDGNGHSVTVTTPEMSGKDTTKDTLEYTGGDMWHFTHRISTTYVLQSADIYAFVTSNSNFDYVRVNYAALAGIINPNTLDTIGTKMSTTITTPRNGASFNTTALHWKHWFDEISAFIGFPKNTYADLTQAQTKLSGAKIKYELATPIVTELTLGQLPTYPKHTAVTVATDTIAPDVELTAKVWDGGGI